MVSNNKYNKFVCICDKVSSEWNKVTPNTTPYNQYNIVKKIFVSLLLIYMVSKLSIQNGKAFFQNKLKFFLFNIKPEKSSVSFSIVKGN